MALGELRESIRTQALRAKSSPAARRPPLTSAAARWPTALRPAALRRRVVAFAWPLDRETTLRLLIVAVGICSVGLCCAPAGLGQQLELRYPVSIAARQSGGFYLADRDLPGIWEVVDGRLRVLYQGKKVYRTPMNAVRCVERDHEGRLLAGDSATREIYRFDAAGQPQPLTRGPGDAFGKIGNPIDIAVASNGDIYVSDLEIHRIVKVPATGGTPTEVAHIPGCRGLYVDSNDQLWVVSTTADQLLRITADGRRETVVPGRPFAFPHTVLVDAQGTALVCDGYGRTVWKVVPNQAPQKWVSGAPLVNPVGMAWLGEQLLVADPRARAVFQIDAEGQIAPLSLITGE